MSRQFLLELSPSSFVVWDSPEEEAPPLVEASPGFVRMRSNNNTELQGPQEHATILARELQQPSRRTIALWCFLDDQSTYIFAHFPHAMQALSQCWSFFQSQQAQLQATTASSQLSNDNNEDMFQCHINLNRVTGLGSVAQDWRAALIVKLMKCTYDYTEFNLSQLPQNSTVVSLKHPPDKPQDQKQSKGKKRMKRKPELPRNTATHTYYLFRPHRNDSALHRFFWDPQHGQVLRNRLFETKSYRNHNNISETTNSSNSMAVLDETALRIGLVNRLKNRKVGNMDQLEKAIRRMYPDCIVENANMEGMKPIQQFTWWSRQSIVILPHGAASTNLLFLKAGSAIIELFPPHYYEFGFWALSKSLNVRYYGYFPLMARRRKTSQSKRKKLVVKMYEEFKENCRKMAVDQMHRTIPVHYPSIPHVLVLLRRAVADRQLYQQQTLSQKQSDRNVSSWSYVPQISKMVSWCWSAQHVFPNEDNLVHHFDDDPPQSFVDEYS